MSQPYVKQPQLRWRWRPTKRRCERRHGMNFSPVLKPGEYLNSSTSAALHHCMANPGILARIYDARPEDGALATSLAVLRCLVDSETTYALILSGNPQLRQTVHSIAGVPTDLPLADVVLAEAST